MQTRTQKYAVLAYPSVAARKDQAVEKKYRTVALNFPTLILQAGLTQAVGFFLAKSKDSNEHECYLQDLAHVLGVDRENNESRGVTLHKRVISSQLGEYQHLTRQALEASAALKRFTQALLKGE